MSWLDIIGSTLLAGAVILAVIGLNFLFTDSTRNFGSDLSTQENMVGLTERIQWDFAKIGYRVTNGKRILVSKSDTLMFAGDMDNNGTVDTVKYFKGSTSTRSNTHNPKDFLLYRVSKTDTMKLNEGLTRFD